METGRVMRWKTISAQWSIVFQLFKWSRSRSVFSAYSLHAVGKTLDCNSILKSVSICATKWPSNRPMYHCLMINLQSRDVSKTLYLLGMFLFDQDIPQFSTPDYLIFPDNYFSPNSLLLPKSPYCVLNNANLCPLCGFFPVLSPSAPIPFPFNKLVACTPSP